MNLIITSILLAIMIASTVMFGWMGARPRTNMTEPRLVPWQLLMLIAAAGAMMMLVHAVNLLGVKTGH